MSHREDRVWESRGFLQTQGISQAVTGFGGRWDGCCTFLMMVRFGGALKKPVLPVNLSRTNRQSAGPGIEWDIGDG